MKSILSDTNTCMLKPSIENGTSGEVQLHMAQLLRSPEGHDEGDDDLWGLRRCYSGV